MRNIALLGVAAAVVLGLGGVVAASTGSQAAEAATGPRTLTFDVVFSDQLSTKGRLTLHLARLAGR